MGKPYLEENTTIAFLIEWGGYVLFLLLILSPFIYLWFRRHRGINWRQIVSSYLVSFVIFGLLEYMQTSIHIWIQESFINYGWLTRAITAASLRLWVSMLFLWPLNVLFVSWLKYERFTFKKFFGSLIVGVLLFMLLATSFIYMAVYYVGQAFMEHF